MSHKRRQNRDNRPQERKLAPGIYLVGDSLLVDCPELLRHFGVADTPENRNIMTRAALDAVRKIYPGVPQYVDQANVRGQHRVIPAEEYEG